MKHISEDITQEAQETGLLQDFLHNAGMSDVLEETMGAVLRVNITMVNNLPRPHSVALGVFHRGEIDGAKNASGHIIRKPGEPILECLLVPAERVLEVEGGHPPMELIERTYMFITKKARQIFAERC